MNTKFTFSAGVWNLNTGSDPFGPAVRPDKEFAEKCRTFKRLGFDFVQLHDDDAVPMDVPPNLVEFYTKKLKTICEDNGVGVEFIAPRLWEDPEFADGSFTSGKARISGNPKMPSAPSTSFSNTVTSSLKPTQERAYSLK